MIKNVFLREQGLHDLIDVAPQLAHRKIGNCFEYK